MIKEQPEVVEEQTEPEPEPPRTKQAAPKTPKTAARPSSAKDDRPGNIKEQERLRKILYG